MNEIGKLVICKITKVKAKAKYGEKVAGKYYKRVILKAIDKESKYCGRFFHINIYEDMYLEPNNYNYAHNVVKNNLKVGNIFEGFEIYAEKNGNLSLRHTNRDVELIKSINNE